MNKAIIIGSGIAGLATAARLLSKGYDVSIFEAGEVTGGKIHSFNLGEYRFDAGPSLFTLPYLVDELFENLGENPRDHFNYIKKRCIASIFGTTETRLLLTQMLIGLVRRLRKNLA